MNWLKTLNDTLLYIEDHIDEDINIQEVARMSHLS